MIGDEDVEASETFNGFRHKGTSGLGIVQVGGDRKDVGTALFRQSVRLRAGAAIAEGDLRIGRRENAHRGGADATGATGDESDFTGEG